MNMDENQPTPTLPARIVIVDDHPNTASMLARVLKKFDIPTEVITANSGEEAFQLIGNERVDVLITDFIMPGMSGLELIEKLRKEGHEPEHTILITAYDIPGLPITIRQLKIQDYLIKPVDPEKIRNIVAKVLKQIHPTETQATTGAQGKPPKILIADDNPDNIRLLAIRLKSEGYQFVTAEDGEQTLQVLRAEMPDLVLLDVNMPNKDGFEVLAEMRADQEIAHIPVIIITAARIGIKDVREGLTLGADDYITKPFDWRELSARINKKIQVKRAEDALRTRNKELGVLPEISLDLGERLDVEELTKSILKRTVEALGANNGYLVVFHPDGGVSFQIYKVYDLSPWTGEEARHRFITEGVIAQAVATRQSLIVSNAPEHPGWLKLPNDKTGSAVIVPLLGRKDVLGVLTLTHELTDYFTTNHQTLLQAIASQSTIAIENAHLYATERKRVNELVALNQMSREISRFTLSTELWDNLPRLVRETLGYPAVGLWLMKDKQVNLHNLVGTENAPKKAFLEIAPQQVVTTNQPAQFSGPIEDQSGERGSNGKPPVQSVIAVPLLQKGKIFGVLSIHSNRSGAFQESDRVVLETLAAQIASVYERILLFESIEHERQQLSAVLRSAADAILVLNAQGQLLMANPAGDRLFTDVSTRIGQTLPVKKGYDELIGVIEKARQTIDSTYSEIHWPDNRTFSIVVTPIEDGGQVAILHDVSHFKALDQLKNEFLATATHDLKNPIFAVLGYSDLLGKAGELNNMQIDFVHRIRAAAVQMQDLVLNLLEIARAEMDPKLTLEQVNLNELINNVVDEFQPSAQAKQHMVTTQLTNQTLMVRGDKARLQQVARNLLGNAIKYTPNGGHISISSELQDSNGVVKVIDTGIGIPEESIPHLFEKFYRVRSEQTQDIEGNGLGLAIVKSIIEQHGGQVGVESEFGKGSCFSFQLPVIINKG